MPIGPTDYFVPVDDPSGADPSPRPAGDAEPADDKGAEATDEDTSEGGTPAAAGASTTGLLRARLSAGRDRKPPAGLPPRAHSASHPPPSRRAAPRPPRPAAPSACAP